MRSTLRSIGRYVAFTYVAIGRHLVSIWALSLLAACFEGIGILLFIPILMRMVSPDPGETAGMLAGAVSRFTAGFSIETLLALMVLLFASKGALVFGIGVYRSRVFARARQEMRMGIFDALERVRVRDVESQRLGTLANLLVHEIAGASYAMDRVCAGLGSFTTATMLFLIAVALNPALSVVLVASGGVSLLLLRWIARLRMAISRKATGRAGHMASLAVESMQAFKYLRATGRFGVLRNAFGGTVRDARRLDDRAAVVDHLRFAIREPLLVFWIGAVFYLFVVVLRQSVGVITDGILFFYRVSIELTIFQDHFQDFSARVGSVEAYERLRRELEGGAEPEDRGRVMRFEESIRLDGVGFAYRDLAVLEDLDIEIPKRRTVALVGASGVGKSTVVDLVAGCLDPSQGSVRIDGVDLRDLRRGDYRRALGYVTQESVIFSGSVARNVTMHWEGELGEAELARARDAAELANCLDFIEQLEEGWHTELGEGGVRLSGGERQRVAIARELYAQPQLLILDEATSALDSISERAVQRSLERLHGRVTLLVVAHRLSTIRHADIVYVIEDGRVAESGTFDDLSQRPHGYFRKLCEMQSLV